MTEKVKQLAPYIYLQQLYLHEIYWMKVSICPHSTIQLHSNCIIMLNYILAYVTFVLLGVNQIENLPKLFK